MKRIVGIWVVLILLFSQTPGQGLTADPKINNLLEPIRQKYKLPSLAGAIATSKGLLTLGAVGVRKAGTTVPVTVNDQWHLGSDTTAMTSTLVGALVEQGKLKWDMTLEQAFPDLASSMQPALRTVTFLHLLSHRAGLQGDFNWGQISQAGTIRQQRETVVKMAAAAPLLSQPGSQYSYSNLGYVVAGAMVERVMNETWENLITRTLFQPLLMSSAGFGGTGSPGQIDQPWPHRADGTPTPTNGPTVDNPPVLGPAGTVHAPLNDWAKYIADQILGERGEKALLQTGTYKKLHTPPFGGDYALGWIIAQRTWGGGTVFTHAGSNTLNYAVVWIAPQRDFAVFVCTNQGGDTAAKACDEAAGALISYQLQ